MNNTKTYILENCKPAYMAYTEVYRINGERITSQDTNLYVIPNEVISKIGPMPTIEEFENFVTNDIVSDRKVVNKIDFIIKQLNRAGIDVELLYTYACYQGLTRFPVFAATAPLVTLSPTGSKLKKLVDSLA